MKPGKLFIISGPSQVGKDSIVSRLKRDQSLHLAHIIGNTTRPKRPGEQQHIYLNFWSEGQFQKLIDRGEFLEWAIVHDYHYGTLKQPVVEALKQGLNVILNIDVQGAEQIKTKMSEVKLIFITAESPAELKRRIFASTKMTLQRKNARWTSAQKELKEMPKYEHVVVNRLNRLNETVAKVKRIITQELKAKGLDLKSNNRYPR